MLTFLSIHYSNISETSAYSLTLLHQLHCVKYFLFPQAKFLLNVKEIYLNLPEERIIIKSTKTTEHFLIKELPRVEYNHVFKTFLKRQALLRSTTKYTIHNSSFLCSDVIKFVTLFPVLLRKLTHPGERFW